MHRTIKSTLALLLILLFTGGCSTSDNNNENSSELTISAASSLKNVLAEIEKDYQEKQPDIKLKFNFGSSGALKQQISQGAPVDLFISASDEEIKELINEKMIAKEDTVELINNELALIIPKSFESKIEGFSDLKHKDVLKIGLGTPETVPAGMYAKETLQNLQVWDSVDHKMVYGKDVRQVLTYVETGNVDAGIVYKTDALTSEKISIVETANTKWHSPIIYPAAIIKDSKNKSIARDFHQYLQSESAMAVFEKNGFTSN